MRTGDLHVDLRREAERLAAEVEVACTQAPSWMRPFFRNSLLRLRARIDGADASSLAAASSQAETLLAVWNTFRHRA
jgi:hypothetical protein